MTQPLPYQPVPDAPWAVDLRHLRTLAICHYVGGVLSVAFSSMFIVHIVLGVMVLKGSMPFPVVPPTPAGAAPVPPPAPPPQLFGWVFVGMGSAAVLIGWATGILTIISGRCIAKQRGRTFSLVMAGVNCLSVPLGTVLGVFTFVILFRESVKALYDHRRANVAPAAG